VLALRGFVALRDGGVDVSKLSELLELHAGNLFHGECGCKFRFSDYADWATHVSAEIEGLRFTQLIIDDKTDPFFGFQVINAGDYEKSASLSFRGDELVIEIADEVAA
jgi:hypothetical protein